MGRSISCLLLVGAFAAVFSFSVPCSAIKISGNISTEEPKTAASFDPAFANFISEKEAHAHAMDQKYHLNTPTIVWRFFDAAEKGDWLSTSNLFISIESGSSRYNSSAIPPEIWNPVQDVFGGYEQFRRWDLNLLKKFSHQIIECIPPGSIYFGGSDSGRFLISAMSKSHNAGRPFFTITQNQLADGTYLNYLRELYGGKIQIPTREDSQKAFSEYVKDAMIRSQNKQLKDGEEFSMKNGRAQVTGSVAVMLVNERLAKSFIEKNRGKEFYMEESFVLEGFYPYLLPHGLIFKIAPQPIDRLPDSIIEKDQQFWEEETRSLIGKVVEEKTTVPQLCSWAERLLIRNDRIDFRGNKNYLDDDQASPNFSKCRCSIASMYEWRSKQPAQKKEATQLIKEADFAYRQAIALGPQNPETVLRYSNFLFEQKKTNDARLLIKTALKLHQENTNDWGPNDLVSKLRKKAKELKIEVEP